MSAGDELRSTRETGDVMLQLSLYLCSLFALLAGSVAFEVSSLVPGQLSRLEHTGRVLGQDVRPDCGRAFQPCCSSGEVCTDPGLSCIARQPQARCEPCGSPFAQPCPIPPYCEAIGLIPTTRRSDVNIQCRPCGFEWQPCCAVLGDLCTEGFTCYAEQDRCVVPEYTYVKEEFFPDLIPAGGSGSPICGGLNDPPCMEPSSHGPTWQCDDGLLTHIPVFLCMLDNTDLTGKTQGCGRNLETPCEDGCFQGLTLVVLQTTGESFCLKTFSLTSDTDLPVPMPSVPEPTSPGLAPAPSPQVPPVSLPQPPPPAPPTILPPPPASESEQPDSTQKDRSEGCGCGLMLGADGLCTEDPAGCIDSDGPSMQVPADPLTPDAVRDAGDNLDQGTDGSNSGGICGSLGAVPCTLPRLRPCQCGLFLDTSNGRCEAEVTSGPCPVRPYCGFESGPPCSFPGDQPCDECLEVDPVSAICIRNPNCVRESAVDDQSFKCGRRGAMPCPSPPFCKRKLAVGEDGKCERCGHMAGAVPCTSYPACNGRRTSDVEGITLETCEDCGGEGDPPCSDNLRDPPCDDGLFRVSVMPGDGRMIVAGQRSICTEKQVNGQCGFVGQASCSGMCQGRSRASEDGKLCMECGAASQVVCDGSDQAPCDDGLEKYQTPGHVPVCVCPPSGCARVEHCSGDAILDQTRPGGDISTGDEIACGELGQFRCVEEPFCGDRLLPDEDGICHPCGDAEGALACPDNPPCGYRLAVSPAAEFCVACGGQDLPVCCDRDFCSEEDPFDTPCDAGLIPIGIQVNADLELQSQVAEAYCSKDAKPISCGMLGQPPCDVGDQVGPGTSPVRPCTGLSTPSKDGLTCIACGREGDPPCINRFKLCTGDLVPVFDQDEPSICIKPTSVGKDGSTIDQSADLEGCGSAGQPWCKTTPTPCIGRTVAAAGELCGACGGAGQFACTTSPPCNGVLRQYQNTCVACGAATQPVCGRRSLGAPCNDGLMAVGGMCQDPSATGGTTDQTSNVEGDKANAGSQGTGCGTDGALPCPGQPSCGTGLFLILSAGQVICSSAQPTVQYPQGSNCGGLGQALCNDVPHCNTGLFDVYPEGICLPQQPTAVSCGFLGFAPCMESPECNDGLILQPDKNICIAEGQEPCGVRGSSICFGQQSLCKELLYPTFPLMLCADSIRIGSPQPCGVLGSTACPGLACASPFVVHPSTGMCVPAEVEPCGALEQSKCFWNSNQPCEVGLTPDNGICRQ